jgi:uncharacterized membrane protein YfcA
MFQRSHPNKEGTGVLVDYNVASLMLPMIILGASIGVMLNKIIPAFLISILFTVLILLVSYVMLKKVIAIVRAE